MEQFNSKTAPVSRTRYGEVCVVLLSLLAVPAFLYGPAILLLPLTGVVTAVLLDAAVEIFFKRRRRYNPDLSSVTTALIATLLLSPATPLWVAAVTVLFGLGVAKYPFGGSKNAIFNPAAVGLAFSALCWPELVLRYPLPSETLVSTQSFYEPLNDVLRLGGTPKVDFFNLLLGQYAGPMGATAMLVLAACFAYLAIRRLVSPVTVLSALGTAALYALLFPRLSTGPLDSVIYELAAGALVYGCIFMADEPGKNPKTRSGQAVYGASLGLYTMLFRQFGSVPFSFIHALLLANVTALHCDRAVSFLQALFSRRKEVRHG